MNKINKILKKLMIIDVILIPICVVVLLFLSFRGRAYVTVNEKNEEYILHMLSSNGIELEGSLKKLVICKDWETGICFLNILMEKKIKLY